MQSISPAHRAVHGAASPLPPIRDHSRDYAAAAPGFCVCKLAGHLAAMLEACAELGHFNPLDATGAGSLRRAELGAITHLLQARACARDASLEDLRLGECIDFFIAGTEALERAPVMPLPEPMLGQRLSVAIAVRFARVMLDVLAAVYPAPAASQPASAVHADRSRDSVYAA